jgi:hypothetical protein
MKNLALEKGQTVLAKVIEKVSDGVLIVSIYGNLIRVVNESNNPIQINQVIQLTVTHQDPLQFKIENFSKSTRSSDLYI